MCLIVFSWYNHPKYKLILAANRDEFYARPSERIHSWQENEKIIAGKDGKEGGTWMGVTREGRFAALTNYRDPQNIKVEAPSRGKLVKDYLAGTERPSEYLNRIKNVSNDYNGFNLLVGDGDGIWYLSNYQNRIFEVAKGTYGLSNHLLNTPWPKVNTVKNAFNAVIKTEDPKNEELFQIMADSTIYEDEQLPRTGIPLEWERAVSAIFIRKDNTYGTVNTTLLKITQNNDVEYVERVHGPNYSQAGEKLFRFKVA